MFDLTKFTLGTEEAKDVSKVIFDIALKSSKIAEYHDIKEGILGLTQIPFFGSFGKVGKEIGSKAPTESNEEIVLTEKKWEPALVGDRFMHFVPQGTTGSNRLLQIFGEVQRVTPDLFDQTTSNSPELQAISLRVSEALAQMIDRLVWLGDKDAKTIADGGVLKDGTDKEFYTPINGIWKQIINTEIPTTSKYYSKIDTNDGADYDAQANLPDDFAFNLFRSMWAKADSRLLSYIEGNTDEKLHLHVTPAIAQNWTAFKENKSVGFTLNNVEGGRYRDSFRGVDIIVRHDWQTDISTVQDNGTKYNLPQRALLTIKSNIPIGTVSKDDLMSLNSFYDPVSMTNIIDFGLMLDAKILQDYLAVAAY